MCPTAPVSEPGRYVYVPGKSCQVPASKVDILPPAPAPACSCRYNNKVNSRSKRNIPILQHGVNFMVGLLPPFIKFPIQQTVNLMKYKQNQLKTQKKVNNIKKNLARQNNNIQKSLLNPKESVLDTLLKPTKMVKDSELNKESYDFMKTLTKEENNKQRLLQPFLPETNSKLPMTHREKQVLLEKLKKLNTDKRRSKRSIIIGSDELSMPFFEVKDDDFEEQDSAEYEGEDYSSGESEENMLTIPKYYQKKLELKERLANKKDDIENEILAKHPLLYLIKAPVTLMKQFHEIHETMNPMLKQGAEFIGSSKQYFKDFHKNFHKGMLNLASNVIGDFDHVGPKPNLFNGILAPARRFRRSADVNSENFREAKPQKARKKRYILKVVDEKEVHEFLKEKLGNIMDDKPKKPAKKKKKIDETEVLESILKKSHKSKDPIVGNKKMKVEKLKPKIIIDNNGIPFMEMNGVKRPMVFKRKVKPEDEEEVVGKPQEELSEETEKTGDKLSDLIELARDKVENGEPVMKSKHTEMPVNTLKERITQLLAEVDSLVNMDFGKYSDIHDDLLQCQIIKTSIVEDWKKILMERKINDIALKLNILDKIKQLQEIKEDCVKKISCIIGEENRFMTKTLIIIMIRLQKMQCLISRIVDDFSHRMKLGREFDVQKEIQLVDMLDSINLVYGMTRNDNLMSIKKSRDTELQENMNLLENLRKLMHMRDIDLITEEAAVIWEMKNIEKLQKDTMEEMKNRIDSNLRIKKELKIIFDLEKQWDQCNTQQKSLLKKISGKIVGKNEKQTWLDKFWVKKKP